MHQQLQLPPPPPPPSGSSGGASTDARHALWACWRRYKCAVFVGHDEYWSWQMRDCVDRYTHGERMMMLMMVMVMLMMMIGSLTVGGECMERSSEEGSTAFLA